MVSEKVIWCNLLRYPTNQRTSGIDALCLQHSAGSIATVACLNTFSSLTRLQIEPRPP